MAFVKKEIYVYGIFGPFAKKVKVRDLEMYRNTVVQKQFIF